MLDKLKAILNMVWFDICDTYRRIKIVVFAIVGIIIALEFNKLKEFLIAYQGKKEMEKDQKIDSDLASKEKTENDQADALTKKAKDEPNPSNDWYKK
jgi:hypothetical protein